MKTIIASCLVLLTALTAAAADLPALVETEAKVERCALRGDAAALGELVTKIDADLNAKADDPALLYVRAYACYAEASAARAHNEKGQSAKHMEAAVALLEKISDPAWEAEALALRGYMYNQLIGVKGMASAMSLGPKSSSILGKARGKAPANPRVLFFNGVSLVTTPEMWGGDLAGGTALLEKAVEAFEHQAANAFPRWGEAEALVWLGIGKQKTGDLAGARAAWEHALALEPEYGWVKYNLLPSLDKDTANAKK